MTTYELIDIKCPNCNNEAVMCSSMIKYIHIGVECMCGFELTEIFKKNYNKKQKELKEYYGKG